MYVTNIQRFSLDDGPGIRTTVFLAGCNMRCLWCHNPENLKAVITRCDDKINGYSEEVKNSRDISSREIMKTVLKDLKFYNKTGGGVTISGGEPICQIEELEQLLKMSKESDINTAIETALNYDYSNLERLFSNLDLIIADCKAVNESIHIKCTGATNKKILENIKRLSDEQRRLWIRIPVVPDVNITFEEIKCIGDFLADKNVEIIELLPYHKMGISKYKIWGMEYMLNGVEVPTKSYMKTCYDILSKTCKNVIWQEEKPNNGG